MNTPQQTYYQLPVNPLAPGKPGAKFEKLKGKVNRLNGLSDLDGIRQKALASMHRMTTVKAEETDVHDDDSC